MQTDFALWELKTEPEFTTLWSELRSSDNLYYLTDRVCKIYEKPAFNNVQVRFSDAQQIGAILASPEMQHEADDHLDEPETTFWPPRGFNPGGCPGVFNSGTEKTLRAFQEAAAITVDGVAGRESFTALGLAPGIFD